MFETIRQVIDGMDLNSISSERKVHLDQLRSYIQGKRDAKLPVQLNFICTHNSRRSQFAQLWAQVAADYYGIEANCFSGGVEITAFNPRAVASLKSLGFKIDSPCGENPKYEVHWKSGKSLKMFSKLFDDPTCPSEGFAAIMTCSHADENCPFVAGCEQRIPLRYEDPKRFDDSPLESTFYSYRSYEIATELFYVFSGIQ